jgi:hypothetical protein
VPRSDLLCPSRDNLSIHEGERGTYVGDATQVEVLNPAEVLHWVREALQSRAVGSTLLNADSSRSHLVLTLTVEVGSTVGKLLLVDLAGSEKVKRTGATGSLLTEATAINKSLSALGNVIAALTSNAAAGDSNAAAVVPYRDSKLTRLLKECLSGSAFTTLIGACVQAAGMSRIVVATSPPPPSVQSACPLPSWMQPTRPRHCVSAPAPRACPARRWPTPAMRRPRRLLLCRSWCGASRSGTR